MTKEHFKGVSVKPGPLLGLHSGLFWSLGLGGDAAAAEGRADVNSEPACAQVIFLPCVYALGYVILSNVCSSVQVHLEC